MLVISQIDDIWITANFKETQLKKMHAGQKVDVSVDAYGRKLHGYVESMPGATGSVMSLAATGKCYRELRKVVQRLPVRIRLYPGQDSDHRFRVGMSVEAGGLVTVAMWGNEANRGYGFDQTVEVTKWSTGNVDHDSNPLTAMLRAVVVYLMISARLRFRLFARRNFCALVRASDSPMAMACLRRSSPCLLSRFSGTKRSVFAARTWRSLRLLSPFPISRHRRPPEFNLLPLRTCRPPSFFFLFLIIGKAFSRPFTPSAMVSNSACAFGSEILETSCLA